jgi:8-oxo-dGTP pyrophosphatase MutT (NUDIX family)
MRGVEVLMVRRSTEASYMPGVWVFPGGIIEPEETPAACAARELEEEAGIAVGAEAELVAWSRWITPEAAPVRFDTHFFVAVAPPHTSPRPDRSEVTDAAWFEPRAALDAHRAGELELVFPTIKTLEMLLEHPTSDAVIAAARGREVEPILPRVVGTREELRILLPWDEGYEDATVDTG